MDTAARPLECSYARSLRVEAVRTEAGFAALEPEWVALESAAQVGLPFRTYAWNSAWWKRLAERKLAVRDRLELRTIRDSQTGTLVGIAPLILTEMPVLGPFGARHLQFFGADPNLTEVRGIVCAPSDETQVASALHLSLLADYDQWDWMTWQGLPLSDGATGIEPGSLIECIATTSYRLPLPDSFEEVRKRGSRNLKESLRHCYNSLRRSHAAYDLKVLSSWREVEPALELFRTLHTARIAVNPTHPDVFAAKKSSEFLYDVAEKFCERGQMRVFVLHVQGEPAAIRIGFALGRTLYLYYSGFDPRWSRYSVMTTCLAESLRFAIAEGFTCADLSTGTDVSKTRWRPDSVTYHAGVELSPSRRAWLAHEGFHVALGTLRALGAAQVTRKLLGRR